MYLGRIGWGILVGWTIWVYFLPLIIEIFEIVLDVDEKGIIHSLLFTIITKLFHFACFKKKVKFIELTITVI